MTALATQPQFETEAAWLAERLKRIGASEAASVLGVNPYQSPIELYYRKTGQLPPEKESLPMKIGKLMEPVLCRLYEDQFGWAIERKQEFVVSKEYPFMAATLDGVTTGVDGEPDTIVELKTANVRRADEWGETGTDEIPLPYLVQVQHQMIVTRIDLAHVAVLIGNSDFRVYHVPRHDKLCAKIIDREADFWRAVEARKPPKDRPEDAAIFARLAPEFEAEVDLSDNFEAQLNLDLYRYYGDEIKKLEDERNEYKHRLIRSMAHHATARLSDGTILKRATVKKKSYVVEASEYVQFSARKPKGA